MNGTDVSFGTLSLKTIVVHTGTYFVMGLLAVVFLDYAHMFAQAEYRVFMRQLNDPFVAAGPLFQPIRGFLFAVAFFPIRQTLFGMKRGWGVIWLLLVVLGVLSTFGPSPGSIEGLIYTNRPIRLQLVALPEVFIQSLLLSSILYYWVNHPTNRKLSWSMYILFGISVVASILGVALIY